MYRVFLQALFKNKIWAILRSLWVNFVRITNNLRKGATNTNNKVKDTLHFALFVKLLQLVFVLSSLELLEKK